jgi:hypothetical protein
MEITGPINRVTPGTAIKLEAYVMSTVPDLPLTYNWIISSGKITSGQGTRTITVDTSGLSSQFVTATVKIDGMPEGCPTTASYKVQVVSATPKSNKTKKSHNGRQD